MSETREIEHISRQINGLQFHAVQAGPSDGPLIVLLHGFPEFWWGWRHQIEPLAAAGFHILAPDQRGYNLSDKPGSISAYDIDLLALDVIGWISGLGYKKAVLIGHDWGAAVAWHAATLYPEWVEKLAILNVPHPAVMLSALQHSFQQWLKSWYIFYFQLPGLPERMLSQGNYAGMKRMMHLSAHPDTFSRADLERYAQAWSRPGALTAMIHWYRAFVRRSLSRLTHPANASPVVILPPTLMLWGKQDIALSEEMAAPSIDLCRDGRLVFFENATHWVQHDEAEAVTNQLIKFLG